MVRFIAIVLAAFVGAIVIETYTDTNFGALAFLEWFMHNGLSGGYAIATNVTTAVVDTMFGRY